MPRITEEDMENIIETDLVNSGYFSREDEQYDKAFCLDTGLLLDFLIATQKEKWEQYKTQMGTEAEEMLFGKIKEFIDKNGTTALFRKPFPTRGIYFDLAYFKPASRMNKESEEKYRGNIFSVTRQVHYSDLNQNSLDMVIFLNGIPIATMELKDKMTGSGYRAESAIRQYQNDRDPKEPLFRFGRCFVHFAFDEDNVYMTTQLKSKGTRFLPFNKGNKGQAGNPPTAGFSSEYLWKEVLAKDSFLELIQYFIQETDVLNDDFEPTGKKQLIFPRYHQLDAVRQLIADAKKSGEGQNYLIQHSAGSGKSNTISWLAHQLSSLHDNNDNNVFDSVLVITDRKIIDAQLSATISSFEQTPGVVAALGRTSRGKQLKELLEGGTKIIIGTLQTFPVIAETLINKQGSKFAVIVDEAHSSSSGEMSKALKKVLDSDSEDDVEEEDTTWEDKIDEEMKLRGRQEHISYFAFTATPKPKTLELFGKKQAPEVKPEFRPHHTYSMKQAIQEGFIKDVLPNYTSYKTCYHLLKKIENDPNYDKKKATKLLKVFVELSEPTVAKKTAIIIEHFMENCISEVDGQAKAMVVCASRLQAVRYWLAFNKYLKEIGTPFKALIAFSGIVEVKKPHAEYSEARMNGFPEEQTAQRFRERENKFLIVANKFQTGFDQPLLYAMYINKKLNGVNAVQTLSRLNRVHPNKKDPVTLDFFNEPKIIKEAFQDFYEETMLEEASDPDKMYDYKRQLEVYQYYTQAEVDEFNKLLRVKNFDQSKLNPIINSAVKRYEQDGDKKNRDNFRMLLKTYLRVYSFLAQIVSFQDRELEKLYVYGMILFRKLPFEKGRLPKEVTQQVDLETLKVQYIKKGIKLDEDEGGILKHGDDDPFAAGEEFLEPLSKILKLINEMFAANFSDEDRIVAQDLLAKLSADPSFADEIKNNPKEAVWFVFERRFNDALQSLLEIQYEFYKKLNHDDDTKERLMKEMFGVLYERVKKR